MVSFGKGVTVEAKAVAARRAIQLVQDGMTIGLGSGSTATFAIEGIGDRIRTEGLRITGVPTSSVTNSLAEQLGIPLVDIDDIRAIDLTIDGADEVDPNFCLIKGGGGALVREKLVAAASREVVIICDSSKIKEQLGAFPLPVAVVPFGWQSTQNRLSALCKDITLRMDNRKDRPYMTDDGCHILDLSIHNISDPGGLEAKIKSITGVVEVGLFVNLATRVIVGYEDGTSSELKR